MGVVYVVRLGIREFFALSGVPAGTLAPLGPRSLFPVG